MPLDENIPIVARRNFILEQMASDPTRMVLTEGTVHAGAASGGQERADRPDSPGAGAAAMACAALHLGAARGAGHEAVRRASRRARSSSAADCASSARSTWNLQKIAEKWVDAAVWLPKDADPAAYAAQIGVPYERWMRKLENLEVNNGAMIAHRLPDGRDRGLCRQRRLLPCDGHQPAVPAPVRRRRPTAGGSPDRRSSRSTT